MRWLLSGCVVCALLSACDTQNSAIARHASEAQSVQKLQEDDASTSNAHDGAITFSTELVGVSADGQAADLSLSYSLATEYTSLVNARSTVSVKLLDSNGHETLLARSAIDDVTLSGQVDVVVPTDATESELLVSLDHIETNPVGRLPLYSTIAIPDVFPTQNTPLDQVHSLSASLIDNSYSSSIVGNRRIHRFAIEVLGQVGDNTEPDYITGLEENAAVPFFTLEDGYRDVESPVQVNYTSHPLAVYFVLDVSGSMVSSGQSAALLDAASRAAIALAPGSDFDVRVFAGNVYRKPDLRNIEFDDPSQSATALYYAIDSALVDIENHSSQNQDKILLVFTDGRDLASRNYYPAFTSTQTMNEYIVNRMALVAQSQASLYQRNFAAHVIGFEQSEGDLDTAMLKNLAVAGKGNYYNVNDPQNNFANATIQSTFARVVKNVRGTYYLEYSSQQIANQSELSLTVTVGEHTATIDLP